jgi:hypothetical protein
MSLLMAIKPVDQGLRARNKFSLHCLSSAIDKSFKLESVPPLWKERFGPSIGKRAIGAFLGGIVAMIGARMVGGSLFTVRSGIFT